MKDSFCSYCGSEFINTTKYPRNCVRCLHQTWSNPLPVVVVLQPVVEPILVDGKDTGLDRIGLLIQKRDIEPKRGEWALSGGYIDSGETWQQAAVREMQEEVGMPSKESYYELWDVRGGSDNRTMLVFCYNKHWLKGLDKLNFQPNIEVSALDVMWNPMELAFPTHTEEAARYLERLKERV
jgi:ADP-ribose pyrophosphatase